MSLTSEKRLVVEETGQPVRRPGHTHPWLDSQKDAIDFLASVSNEHIGDDLFIMKVVTKIHIKEPEMVVRAIDK